MAGFPPAKGNQKPSVPSYDCPPASTGNGGLKASLKVKAAGNKNAPSAGFDKNVNGF